MGSGRTLQYIAEHYATLCKAFHYLYGHEFKSSKVDEFIDQSRESEDAGICPHCQEHYQALKFHIMRMHQKHKSFTFAKEGILHSKTDIALTKIRTRWATFCQISYFNHEGPPTEENFIDFLSKKKESGRTVQYIAELYATLCKAFHYLYGHEFKSSKVDKFIDEFRENEDAGICPHCGEHYRTLKFHIMRMHQKDKPFKCKECDNSYINKSELDMHFKYRHSKDVDIKICHLCGYETKYKEALKVHIKITHENITRFSCAECDKKFYAKSHLKRHIKAAHRKSIEGIKCVTCGLELKTGSALLKHKNKVHRGMKFVCDICNKEYSDYSILKRHKKNVHNVIMGRKLNFSTNNKI